MKKLSATVVNVGPLSKKEAIILRYLCEGFMRKEIASKVCRTQSCVGKQIESIAHKLDCHSAAEIVATATALDMVKIKITEVGHWLQNLLSILLVFNIALSHVDMRGPRSPRPIKTRTTARLVRSIRQA